MSNECENCNHSNTANQSLDEMEFERGIWSAAMFGDLEKIEKLVNKNNEVNKTDNYGFTALHYAARNGQLKACQLLVNRGAHIDPRTKELQATPLHRAATMGHEEVVNFLISKKADIFLKDSDGKTAMDRAKENNKINVVRILEKIMSDSVT